MLRKEHLGSALLKTVSYCYLLSAWSGGMGMKETMAYQLQYMTDLQQDLWSHGYGFGCEYILLYHTIHFKCLFTLPTCPHTPGTSTGHALNNLVTYTIITLKIKENNIRMNMLSLCHVSKPMLSKSTKVLPQSF